MRLLSLATLSCVLCSAEKLRIIEPITADPFDCATLVSGINENGPVGEEKLLVYVEIATRLMKPEALKCIGNEYSLKGEKLVGSLCYFVCCFLLSRLLTKDKVEVGLEVLEVFTEDLGVISTKYELGNTINKRKRKSTCALDLKALSRYFLDHGAPLKLIILARLYDDPEFFSMFLDYFPVEEFNPDNHEGYTALLIAGALSNRQIAFESTTKLLAIGADPNVRGNSYLPPSIKGTPSSPLKQALALRRYEIAICLMRHRAVADEFVREGLDEDVQRFLDSILPVFELVIAARNANIII